MSANGKETAVRDVLGDAIKKELEGRKTQSKKDAEELNKGLNHPKVDTGVERPPIEEVPSIDPTREGAEKALGIDVADEYHKKALDNAKLSPYAYYKKNIARGSASLNANRHNSEDTLKYSRLADYMNNIQWMKKPSTATVGMGFKGLKEGEAGEWHNPHKIETEETRQQDTIRRLSELQSTKKIELQDRYNNMDAMYQEAKMLQKLRLEGAITEMQYEQLMKIWQEKFYQRTQAPHREAERRRDEWYSRITIPDRIGKILAYYAGYDPVLYDTVANAFNTIPMSTWQLISKSYERSFLRDLTLYVSKHGQERGVQMATEKYLKLLGNGLGAFTGAMTDALQGAKEGMDATN